MTHSKSEGLAAGGGLGRDSGQAGFGLFTRIEQALRYVLQVRDCVAALARTLLRQVRLRMEHD